MIVVDTNVIACFLVPGPVTASAQALFKADGHWVAPKLWRSELRNVMLGHVRRHALTFDQAADLQAQAEWMMAGNDYELSSLAVLTLARDSGCTAYDCEFVALSRDLRVPLHTADRKLQRAFPETTRLLAA